MTGTKVTSSGNLIVGCCVIAGINLCVLYDFEAKHSFCVGILCSIVGFIGDETIV